MTRADQPSRPTDRPARQGAVAFRERVLPGPGGWVAALAFAAVLGVALWPASPATGVVVGLVAAVLGVAALVATSPVVSVHDGALRAGRATIPVTLTGPVRALDAEEMRTELGPVLDARAYVCLRAWARTGVRLELHDAEDPTPYWLVSTRRAPELADALRAAGAAPDVPSP
ncbi:DUF3093 domain-containing protein [Cellulosimicrobium marinum]|uniref:DUF3093 domain-containing protein n=1 Tax=Cellulosimicrobium marinum TaxID=1638992 RepID=UPI001E3F0F21|nr:DUF3093 domain-containing protein [Cellulosimicrobium marinum]MCB7138132.1 DUF3093 domain-containing protein [Cellulosimicrobium marinum]